MDADHPETEPFAASANTDYPDLAPVRKSDANVVLHVARWIGTSLREVLPWIWKGSSKPQDTFNATDLKRTLRRFEEDSSNLSALEQLDDVLLAIVTNKNRVSVFEKQWKVLISDVETIREMLLDFSQGSREHAWYNRVSDETSQALQSLSHELIQVVGLLRECLSVNRVRLMFYRYRISKNINKCQARIATVLQTIKILVTPREIYNCPLDNIVAAGVPVDVTPHATSKRYRLLDCRLFVSNNILQICEFANFPHVEYSAISYVWRGNVPDPDSTSPTFSVLGAEAADPISVEVLMHACTASLSRGVPYLWIDRLCILQTSREDKQWQIGQMFRMYQSCRMCIVIPGGVQLLVRLDQETSWIHRGWTLQEVLAPRNTVVLFAWKLGSGTGRAGEGAAEEIKEVVPQKSAMAPFSLILDACVTGTLSFHRSSTSLESSLMVECKMFSAQPSNFSYNDIPFWQPQRKILSPNVSALAVAMDEVLSADEDTRHYAIWQSALMRTSSRPVDMVFSIMGLFGVSLDTQSFHKNDRVGATIALAKEILNQGGTACWMGVSFRLDPCQQISTFPAFPRTSVAGKALIRVQGQVREVSEFMDSEYPNAAALIGMPQGSMDDHGYLQLKRKAIPLQLATRKQSAARRATLALSNRMSLSTTSRDSTLPTSLTANDGSVWEPQSRDVDVEGHLDSVAFAVLLGWFNAYYPGATPADEGNNIRAMIVQQHAPGKFHVRSYLSVERRYKSWVDSWSEYDFCVGGPEEWKQSERTDFAESSGGVDEESQVKPVGRLTIPNDPQGQAATLKDRTTRAARWAVPQKVLEKYVR